MPKVGQECYLEIEGVTTSGYPYGNVDGRTVYVKNEPGLRIGNVVNVLITERTHGHNYLAVPCERAP